MTPWLNHVQAPLQQKAPLQKKKTRRACVSTLKLTVAAVASDFISGEQSDCFVKGRMSHAHRIESNRIIDCPLKACL